MRAAWFMKFAAASGKVTRDQHPDGPTSFFRWEKTIPGLQASLEQHAVAEAMHVVDRALQGLRLAIAEQPHIDRGDAEVF